MERIDADRGGRQVLAQRLAERRRRVDRHHLHGLPPGHRAGGQPGANAGGVTAVDHAEHPAAVGVDQSGHPRLVAPPAAVLVAEEAHRAVAVLIDAQPAHQHVVGVGDQVGGRGQHGLHQPPGHPVGAGDLAGRPAADHDGGDQRPAQPGGRAGEGRHLVGDLAEGASRAAGLVAEAAALDPDQFHRPGHRQIAQPLPAVGVHTNGEHPADRAAGWVGGLHLDPAHAVLGVDGAQHAVVGQVEDRARSVTLRARRLEAGPRALNVSGSRSRSPAHATPFTTNREEPLPLGRRPRGEQQVAADNRLTVEQLAALAQGDTVTIESGSEFGRRRCTTGTVVRCNGLHVVVRCGAYVEHYRLRGGVRIGGGGRAELVNAEGSELPGQAARRQTRRIALLYRQWMRNPSDVGSLRDLQAAIGEHLQDR